MEYSEIKIGDVIECGTSIAGGKGIVIDKYKGKLYVLNKDGKVYDVHPQSVEQVTKNVKLKAILEAIIN